MRVIPPTKQQMLLTQDTLIIHYLALLPSILESQLIHLAYLQTLPTARNLSVRIRGSTRLHFYEGEEQLVPGYAQPDIE